MSPYKHTVSIGFLVLFSYQSTVEALDSSSARIVGGKVADIKDFPYQLSLRYLGEHICGAVIVHENWSVTAAHCLMGTSEEFPLDKESLTLRAGSARLYSGGVSHQIEDIIIHPQFNSVIYDYDIALLKVKTPFIFGENVNAVELPPENWHIRSGARANVTGWGETNIISSTPGFFVSIKYAKRSQGSKVLRKANVSIVGRGICNEKFPHFTTRMLCAGNMEKGGKDSCYGDSGGPLVARGRLVAIVSWGFGCGLVGYPGVYTRVSKLRDWIITEAGI